MGLAHSAIGIKGVVCDGCRMRDSPRVSDGKPASASLSASSMCSVQPSHHLPSPGTLPLVDDSSQGVPD
jgi:hypothetical protein